MSILSYLTLLLTPLFFLVQAQDCLASACPSKEAIQQKVVEIFKQDIRVIKIQPVLSRGFAKSR